MTKTVNTPAKINLYLDVLGKRNDGYHNIKSIMQSVTLFDTVTVTEDDKISIICDKDGVPTDESNIAFKAAKLFFERTGIDSGCRIEIAKRIPVAGGLAGGSTDGAAVLTALNSLYCEPLSLSELLAICARLGADVPFCIKKGCVLCEGIGEIMNDIPGNLSFDIVIAKGGESVSTPAAYRLLDDAFGDSIVNDFGNIKDVIEALQTGNIELLKGSAYNIFEEVVLPRHPEASHIKELMTKNGAVFSMMSGSGPSVFGVFDNSEKTEFAAKAIIDAGYEAHPCRTLEI